MGAALAQVVLGVERPRVALLSNGEEGTKGTPVLQEAHALLTASAGLDFAGNIEGNDVVTGRADVVVTDGFTGNVTLKVVEGVSKGMIAFVRQAAMSSARAKAGGMLLRPALRGLRDDLDPEAQGGAYLLGLRRPAIVPHGSFGAPGFAAAVERASAAVAEDLVARTHAALERAGALRRSPASEPMTSV
jgi:phosphate acyltransferase